MDIAVIVSSVVVFLIIVYLLVIMLFIAEKKLISQDAVEISINDDPDKAFSVKPGGTLLSSLAMQRIFIPSNHIPYKIKTLVKSSEKKNSG